MNAKDTKTKTTFNWTEDLKIQLVKNVLKAHKERKGRVDVVEWMKVEGLTEAKVAQQINALQAQKIPVPTLGKYGPDKQRSTISDDGKASMMALLEANPELMKKGEEQVAKLKPRKTRSRKSA